MTVKSKPIAHKLTSCACWLLLIAMMGMALIPKMGWADVRGRPEQPEDIELSVEFTKWNSRATAKLRNNSSETIYVGRFRLNKMVDYEWKIRDGFDAVPNNAQTIALRPGETMERRLAVFRDVWRLGIGTYRVVCSYYTSEEQTMENARSIAYVFDVT